MTNHLFRLLIERHPETFASLQLALRQLSMETFSIKAYPQTGGLIARRKPHLMFADVSLRDGSWVYIFNLADTGDVPLNVVVAGAIPETQDYLSLCDRRALDCAAPPFHLALLDLVGQAAAMAARPHWEVRARVAAA